MDRDVAQDKLVGFCTDRLLCHLVITDRVLYTVAAGAAETRLLVRALRGHHQVLGGHLADLRRAGSAVRLSQAAHALVAVLAMCLEVERHVLLPVLDALPGADLPGLVEDVAILAGGGGVGDSGGARRSRDRPGSAARPRFRHLRTVAAWRVVRAGERP